MKVLITSPSLDGKKNVSGISSVTKFIIDHNTKHDYINFPLGKRDDERRNILWFLRIAQKYGRWCYTLLFQKGILIHFNISLAVRSIIRDAPLIMIARLLQKRMIIHVHGGEYLMNKEMPGWMKYLLKLAFSGNTPKIVLSPLEVAVLKRRLNIDNLFVLVYCVDLNAASSFTRRVDKDKDEEMRLLFLGRICHEKGLQYVYDALKALKLKGIKFSFIMAGSGPHEDFYVQRFAELLLDDFEFKGVVSGEEKIKVLKNNDVFLLPSFFEGIPLALLESMSFGLVPITTNVGSISYVISDKENGLLVNTQSSEEIALAIEKLSLDRMFKNRLSTNARNYIFQNLKPEEYVSQLNKIYELAD
ncbi:MAG TPA: glycosyltransferase family 4 protein [Chitinophagaceae bacterium]|nr:glycosyltransferase family 4 protein [Chitinophagaceae bacterium]